MSKLYLFILIICGALSAFMGGQAAHRFGLYGLCIFNLRLQLKDWWLVNSSRRCRFFQLLAAYSDWNAWESFSKIY